jgi:two-component system, sensor histidine kinase and response regulator
MQAVENSGINVLIVDDLKSNLHYISHVFESKKYNTLLAHNAQEAYLMLGMYEIDLILLDIEMPGDNGFEACKRIKSDKEWADIPIIFITSRNNEKYIIKGFEYGASDFVAKPFITEELLARAKTQLELRAKNRQLAQLNKHLEEKVDVRTGQLRSALAELEAANKEVLQYSKKLESLASAKSEFLNIISHEIRTPLNGIIGFTELLKDSVEGSELKVYVNYLQKSALRLERFATDALLITELTLGHYTSVDTEFSINDLAEEINAILEDIIAIKSVTIKWNAGETLKLLTDRQLLCLSLRHIIDNSCKYAPEYSEITINISSSNAYVTGICVEDSGPGFSAQALENLFQLFSLGQGHINNSIGLGLSLAKLAIEYKGGKISAANNGGAGACVCIYL